MLQVRYSSTLDGGDFGWLKAKHHFAVGPGGNLAHGPLGALVVWNDDQIAPGTGFDLHGHQDIEIITYVREGAVTHSDSLGNVGVTSAGDVQAISAGTGIRHSERNLGSEPLRLFQIWLSPRAKGGQPQWATSRFPRKDRANRFVVLASGFTDDKEALAIRAEATVLGAMLLANDRIDHTLQRGRHAYLAPARGVVEVNGHRLAVGDGIAMIDERAITIHAHEDSEVILVETV
jgi:redox-sensitive bicupin YhaK (pirin superfamily)